MTDKEIIISELRENTTKGFGKERADELEDFIRTLLANYSRILELPEDDILTSIEAERDYSAVNYYQTANFPDLENVNVFENEEQIKEKLSSGQFRCPACGGISTHPTTCNSGKEMSIGKICDWKAYGLFGTLDSGYHFVVKSDFLARPVVYDIFTPIEKDN